MTDSGSKPAGDGGFSRRRLLMGASVAALTTLVPGVASAAGRRPRLLIVGSSSMGGALGALLERGFSERGFEVLRRHRGASSLTRPDFFDWYAEGERLYEEFRPDATVVYFSANDPQALYTGGSPRWIHYKDREQWNEAYRRRVNDFVDTLAPRGEKVVWLGAPPMRLSQLNYRMWHTNRIYEEAMAWRPAAKYIDTWMDLADAKGRYVDELRVHGRTRTVRAPDGIHIARAGAEVILEHAMPEALGFIEKPIGVNDPLADLPCVKHGGSLVLPPGRRGTAPDA